ncbi:MAG: RNA polymerase sigma factor RpoD/SigA [Phycisphaerales bacterium]|nr:RNA polymerase sigma factor RpoD/SigA [Phycisphaerales bacterium]
MAKSEIQTEIQMYVREISLVALLTPAEEKTLGWAIINDNDAAAKDRMITANLRLVIAISKGYMNRGISLPDLIEEGNVGLIRAVEGFDPAQGARFSTYASWWIKQSIKRTLLNATQPIHIPAYMIELIGRCKAASKMLEEKLGHQPSLVELAREMQVPLGKLQVIRRALRAYNAPNQVTTQNSEGDVADFADVFEDTTSKNPTRVVEENELLKVIMGLLETIDAREAEVLRLRFGLDGTEPLTLNEVGIRVGLTRERVRQIEVETLERLGRQLGSNQSLALLFKSPSGGHPVSPTTSRIPAPAPLSELLSPKHPSKYSKAHQGKFKSKSAPHPSTGAGGGLDAPKRA